MSYEMDEYKQKLIKRIDNKNLNIRLWKSINLRPLGPHEIITQTMTLDGFCVTVLLTLPLGDESLDYSVETYYISLIEGIKEKKKK